MPEHKDAHAGVKLHLFRRRFDLSQADIAGKLWENGEKNASMVRRISYIESGARALTQTEIATLERAYPDYRDFLVPDLAQIDGLVPGFNAVSFCTKQQTMLTGDEPDDKRRIKYDLWFFNGPAQPVLHIKEYQSSWVENISRGANYNIFWDLADDGVEEMRTFKQFLRTAVQILKEVQDQKDVEKELAGTSRPSGSKSGSAAAVSRGTISIYPYVASLEMWGRLRNEFGSLRDAAAQSGVLVQLPFCLWPTTSETQSPKDAEIIMAGPSAIRMLVSCFVASASTVVFMPKEEHMLLEPYVSIEFRTVRKGFNETTEDPEGLHVLVATRDAQAMELTVRKFIDWWREVSSKIAPPPSSKRRSK